MNCATRLLGDASTYTHNQQHDEVRSHKSSVTSSKLCQQGRVISSLVYVQPFPNTIRYSIRISRETTEVGPLDDLAMRNPWLKTISSHLHLKPQEIRSHVTSMRLLTLKAYEVDRATIRSRPVPPYETNTDSSEQCFLCFYDQVIRRHLGAAMLNYSPDFGFAYHPRTHAVC
jgi:hypothetical protein